VNVLGYGGHEETFARRLSFPALKRPNPIRAAAERLNETLKTIGATGWRPWLHRLFDRGADR
jgi:hypothetical protein